MSMFKCWAFWKKTKPLEVSLSEEDLRCHTLVLGTTGSGKSQLLESEAIRQGGSVSELIQRVEQSPEQKEREKMQQDQRREKKASRLDAVREAYWADSDSADSDLDNLHDALLSIEGITDPTKEQMKIFFMMLPESIIGQGIAWGFEDTEVREDIYRFVEENREAITQKLVQGI